MIEISDFASFLLIISTIKNSQLKKKLFLSARERKPWASSDCFPYPRTLSQNFLLSQDLDPHKRTQKTKVPHALKSWQFTTPENLFDPKNLKKSPKIPKIPKNYIKYPSWAYRPETLLGLFFQLKLRNLVLWCKAFLESRIVVK